MLGPSLRMTKKESTPLGSKFGSNIMSLASEPKARNGITTSLKFGPYIT